MIEFKNLHTVLQDIGNELREQYQNNLRESDRIATGNLFNSVKTTISLNGNELSVDLDLEDYWKFIEDGTKPHWPPVNKILEWIKVKKILPHPDKNGKLPTEKQLAYLISRKISIEGTEGKPDLQESLNVTDNERFKERILEALDKDLYEQIDEIIKMAK